MSNGEEAGGCKENGDWPQEQRLLPDYFLCFVFFSLILAENLVTLSLGFPVRIGLIQDTHHIAGSTTMEGKQTNTG